MRLRNVKNKTQILNKHPIIILKPEDYKGRWSQVFKNSNPIYIEIGMGKGQFIINQALNNKNINYIGIEKHASVIVRALEKIAIDIPNLKLIKMDAVNIDQVFINEISLIYLNFSDPWPKKRHAKRRLTSEVFLAKYEKIFKNFPQINFRTDNVDLFTYSIETFTNCNYKLTNVTLDLAKSKAANHISTEYEDKFIQQGHKILAFLASKDN